MEIQQLFSNKIVKPKEKKGASIKKHCREKITLLELVNFVITSKNQVKATHLEVLEIITQKHAEIHRQ